MSLRRPFLINADDLHQWSDRYDAAAQLPLLIRRLVLATRGVTNVSFRTEAGVRLPGWDGFSEGTQPNPFVPVGPAGWELTVQKNDIATKATGEFNKRATQPYAAQVAFMFVTSRRWAGKQTWADERHAEAKFRSVRVLDADDLDGWLEYAPAVHLWWTRELGKHPDGATDVERYWSEWSQATVPPLSTEFIMAGRAQPADSLRQWLASESPSVAVVGPSQEEALAFVAATIQLEPESRREALFGHTVIVSTPESFTDLVGSPSPLLLIPLFNDAIAFNRAFDRKHRLIVSLGGPLVGPGLPIPVGRIDPDAAADALVTAGLGRDRAQQLAEQARRNFSAFKREITRFSTAIIPPWAATGTASALLPLWMAGRWHESNASDLEVLAALSGVDAATLLKTAGEWLATSDPPVRREGQFWYFTTKREGLRVLASRATQHDFERLETAVVRVLGEVDPRYRVAQSERWAYLNRPRHSTHLAEGLAETLAAMGGLGRGVRVSTMTLVDWSARIVRGLLELAAGDWRQWASLAPYLPLLAEAAPRQFLDAIERGLGEDGPILELFKQEGDSVFGTAPHTGVLWALEGLAWSVDYLPRVAVVLTDLAGLDPGGRLANRPRESLRRIFLIWYPQNTLPWKDQLGVLEFLMCRDSEAGWPMLSSLLPRTMDTSLPLHRPRFRTWAPAADPQLTRGEVWDRQRDLVALLLRYVSGNGKRWSDVIETLGNVPKEAHDAIVAALRNLDLGVVSDAAKATIWESLRAFVTQHRRFSEAEWVLPEAYLRRVEDLLGRFEPEDPIARTAWLFSYHAHIARDVGEDFASEDAALLDARLQAVKAVYDRRGVQGIVDMIDAVDEASMLGEAFGGSGVGEEDDGELLGAHLASASGRSRSFARGFAVGRGSKRGGAWILEAAQLPGLTAEQRADLAACLPDSDEAWKLTEADRAVEAAYWKSVYPVVRASGERVEYAARKLVTHGRAEAAVELLQRHLRDEEPPGSAVLMDVLEAFIREPGDVSRTRNVGHHLGELLDALGKHTDADRGRLATFEWGLARFLDFRRPPVLLHQELVRNPGFYVELLSFVFREEGGKAQGEVTEADAARAQLAYSVLQSWKTPPGVAADGSTMEAEVLVGWIERALELAGAARRRTMAEQYIGRVLRYVPSGGDGLWPHEAVRDLLESLKNPQIEKGLEVEIYNSRGVVSRGPTEGGRQERQLGNQYARWAGALGRQWMRIAEVLNRVAEQYEREAYAEDGEAELRKDGMW
ncbi:MAG: hypothetical protein OXG11_14325 [Chloroflexi bacterium]|nr:hypothetical protein [Chloroflexota bacterium]